MPASCPYTELPYLACLSPAAPSHTFPAPSDLRARFHPILQASRCGGRDLHLGDSDHRAVAELIRYGVKLNPEHALTPPYPYTQDLFDIR